MKKLLFALVLILSSFITFAQKQFVVDANAEVREVSKTFNSIKVSGGIDIYLSQSDKEAIAVSASDDKIKAEIKTVIEDNTLKIFFEGDKWRMGGRNKKMIVYISFKNLEKLEAAGASDVVVAGEIKVPSLKMVLSGASDFKGAVVTTSLSLDLSGASDVKISGVASNLDIESSGASDVKGFDLVTEICNARASGASDINITVNKELSAHASGASNIYYRGTGVIKEIHSSGASEVGHKS